MFQVAPDKKILTRDYNQFSRDIGDSKNPTIDAAAEAFDNRLANNDTASIAESVAETNEYQQPQTTQDNQSILEKQARFRAQADEGVANQVMSDQMQAEEGFKEKGNLADTVDGVLGGDGQTLGLAWFFVALLFAAVFDGISFVINFLPFVGGVISGVIVMPIGLAVLAYIHKLGGVSFDKKIRANFLIGAVVEAIPFLNALPGMIAIVVLCKLTPLAIKQLNNNKVLGEINPAVGAYQKFRK